MKLKTKLIPLASAAAVCATVAPITLASCGSNGFVDLTKLYKPGFEKMPQELDEETGLPTVYLSEVTDSFYNESHPEAKVIGATELWTEHMVEHPEDFANEYYWSTSNTVRQINKAKRIAPSEQYARFVSMQKNVGPLIPTERSIYTVLGANQYDVDKERISNVSIDTVTVKLDHTDATPKTTTYEFTLPCVSFTLEYERTKRIHSSSSLSALIDAEYELELRSTGKQVFENVPLVINYSYGTFDIDSSHGVPTFNVYPFMYYGTSEFAKKVPVIMGSEDWKLNTESGKCAWSYDVNYETSMSGAISDKSGTYPVSNIAKESYAVTSADDPETLHYAMQEALLSYSSGLFTSWYLFSTLYDAKSWNEGTGSLWNLENYLN